MSYKVAVASSDGIQIDLHFGQTKVFHIYEVSQDSSYRLIEKRYVGEVVTETSVNKPGPGSCGGKRHNNEQIAVIEDCRAVLSARCGEKTEIELAKQHITSFSVEKSIDVALSKIVKYYSGLKDRA